MAPNKEWMQLVQDRLDNAYIIAVENFMDYAFTRLRETQEICYPCVCNPCIEVSKPETKDEKNKMNNPSPQKLLCVLKEFNPLNVPEVMDYFLPR